MSSKIFIKIITFCFLILFSLVFVFPFIILIINSFKSNADFLSNPLKLPENIEFNNYINAFEKMNYLNSFKNSLIITIFSVILILIFASMTSHLFVRKNWKINKIIFFIMISSMIIPFQSIMIPLVSIYGANFLDILNNKGTLIFMYLGFGMSLAVFIYHGFIKSIPFELEEAAFIDGCNEIQNFFLIVFPLLIPTTITIAILDILWIWNDFLLPNLILTTPETRTLPLSTFYFFSTYTVDYNLLLSGLFMTIIPVIIVYIFLQRYIIKGIMQGSIK